ncbi:SdrD B-like domain-containing protein [Deinococcus sp. UYEF24]
MPRAPHLLQFTCLAAAFLKSPLLSTLVLSTLVLNTASTALAQSTSAPTSSTIVNTATLHAGSLSIPSNTLTLLRRGVCMPDVTPDGSSASPSRRLSFLAPGTITIPYTLTQRGTAGGTVDLTASLLTPQDGVTVSVLDGAGTTGAGSAALRPLDSVVLQSGESRQVLLGVSASRPVSGTLLVNLSASCEGSSDTQNVTALDAQASLNLLLSHSVLPTQATVGDAPTFSVGLPNPASGTLNAEIRIQIPAGLIYQDGSAVLAGGTGSVRLEGSVLIVNASIPVGQTLTVSYRAAVLATAGASVDSVARASGTAVSGGQSVTLTSNQATATLTVTAGVFDRRATLIGQVYLDSNSNGRYDPGDTALPGVRVLLSNGLQALTDDLGRYTFRNINPGAWLVSLDRGQAPFQSEAGMGTRNIDVFSLTRADFALIRPQATLSVPTRSGSIQAGPVQVGRNVVALPGGGSQVTLTITAATPVTDVLLIESLPGDDTREFRFSSLSGTRTVSYLLDGPADLNDPQISWRMP